MNARRLYLVFLCLSLLSGSVSAQWIASLATVAYALGWIMMIIMGIKWIIADSPNERADAKKGMMYVVVGLLVVRSMGSLIALYCVTAAKAMGAPVC